MGKEPVVKGPQLDFEEIAERRLLRPLFDPPPAPLPEVVPPPPPPPLEVKLLGTIVNPQRPQAILRTQQGDVVFKGIGDSIEGTSPEAVIKVISKGSIEVHRGDHRDTLTIE
jgi:hypothetical protein